VTPRFFRTPVEFRAWLAEHHADRSELLVGFYKKGSGRPSMTWPESVDEALSVGWIDGVRRRIDDERYSIRFTPRQPRSIWSNVNTTRVAALTREGRMQPAGLAAFARRDAKKSGVYAFEQKAIAFPPDLAQAFRANAKAWTYFTSTGSYYQRVTTNWVISAKQDETRARRFAQLVESSATGDKVSPFRPIPASGGASHTEKRTASRSARRPKR
jgi:uncharacterized protein YdeI (YjbR/CyaY-like superfamily)